MTVTPVAAELWTGQWVCDRLHARMWTSEPGRELHDLVGMALRRNPRRPHLLVSPVLGKHVPVEPRRVLAAGRELGRKVRGALGGRVPVEAVVLGYAETATALGHCVADALGAARCLHSTRRRVAGHEPMAGFAEVHSHATEHLLLPADPGLLRNDLPLVLVDDELSTGRTALNTIAALHRLHPRPRYLIATLTDVRGFDDRGRMAEAAHALGAQIDVIALATGRITVPAGDAPAVPETGPVAHTGGAPAERLHVDWPAGLPESGRHGFSPGDRERLDAALPGLVRAVPDVPLLVLGTEELMYVPLRMAAALAGRNTSPVLFSSTTRSPVVPIDEPGYAIRSALTFTAPEGDGVRYAYNLAGLDVAAVLVVVDPAADTPALHAADGLLAALRTVGRGVLVTAVGAPA